MSDVRSTASDEVYRIEFLAFGDSILISIAFIIPLCFVLESMVNAVCPSGMLMGKALNARGTA